MTRACKVELMGLDGWILNLYALDTPRRDYTGLGTGDNQIQLEQANKISL